MATDKVTLSGVEITLKPLTFKQLKQLLPVIAKLKDPGNDQVDTMQDIIVEALSRTETKMTKEQLDETETDFAELKSIVNAIVRVAGLEVKKGEAEAGR